MSEAKRGCGYRKQGGLYLVCGKFNAACGGLPFPLEVCPVCSGGIKQARGWTWIEPRQLFTHDTSTCTVSRCDACPVSNPPISKHGLLWIGAAHYPHSGDFMAEARRMGISRRIQFVPNDFKLGETLVYLAHPFGYLATGGATAERKPGIVTVFLPERVELIVTREQANDAAFMEKCDKRGVTPVVLEADGVEEESDQAEFAF